MSLKIEGHLTSKSSPLAPVSCKLSKQFIVQQHLNAHYKNISNAKSAVDNKCPKSWFKYTNVKDQMRKERLLKSAREHIRPDNSSVLYKNRTFRSEFDEDLKSPSGDKLFTDSIKPVGPRIYKNDVKSKIAQLRCYNAPKKRVTARPVSAPRMSAPTPSTNDGMQPTRTGSRRTELNRTESNRSLEFGGPDNQEEDLAYLSFCNDITTDILANNIFTDRGINILFDEHASRNRHRLPMETMLRAIDHIRNELRGKLDPDLFKQETQSAGFEDYQVRPDTLVPKARSTVFENYQLSSGPPVAKTRSTRHEFNRGSYEHQNLMVVNEIDNYRESFESPNRRSASPPFPLITNQSYLSDQNEFVYESCYEEDQSYKYHQKIKSAEVSPMVSPKHQEVDQCAVPQQALQWSLTSSDGGTQKPENIDQLCEEIYDVKLIDNQPEMRDKTTTLVKTSKINNEDENPNRNVHFSNDNQMYSAPESEEHSLTDVTSLKPEDSEGDYDDNNDSTCVESSLDLNNTFKGEFNKENLNETKYEDDFDD